MRKAVFLLIVLVFLAAVSYAAADTEYSLSPCSGSVTISEDKFIILTPDNLGEHTEVLTRIGKTSEQVRSDWEDRGVVLQAWFNNKQLDSCLEVIVRQDEDAR